MSEGVDLVADLRAVGQELFGASRLYSARTVWAAADEVDRLRADLADARQRIITAIGRLSEDDDEQLAIIAILSGYESEALSAGGGGPAEGDSGE